MKRIAKILTSASIVLIAASCGKYSDGPGFTVLTKKMRLTNEWDIKTIIDSDGTSYSDTSDDTFTFDKDGTYRSNSGSISVNGKWEFTSNKEKIRVTYTSGSVSVTEESEILRLTNTELWLKDSDGDTYKSEAK